MADHTPPGPPDAPDVDPSHRRAALQVALASVPLPLLLAHAHIAARLQGLTPTLDDASAAARAWDVLERVQQETERQMGPGIPGPLEEVIARSAIDRMERARPASGDSASAPGAVVPSIEQVAAVVRCVSTSVRSAPTYLARESADAEPPRGRDRRA